VERGITRVQIERPRFDIKEHLWTGTLGMLATLGQATIVVFITYFLLVSGDAFRRKLVKIGPTFTHKRITVQALDEITVQIQRYLLVQVFTSVALGVATWLAFLALGVKDAAVWGVIGCALNFVPYIGAIVFTLSAAMVGFMQFGGSVEMAGMVALVSIGLHVLSGYLFVPWLTSRTSRLNAVAVFVGVLLFGWLWGVWGLLLGVPVLMMVKAVCDRVEDLAAIGEMLGT
jgi:predicted PurR-regulated permease PerM